MSELQRIEKQGIKSKALQVLEKRDRAFRVLCDTVLQVEGATDGRVFSILCCNLRKISGAEGAALASYDPLASTLTLEAVDVEGRNECLPMSLDEHLGDTVSVTPGVVDILKKRQMRECLGRDWRLKDLFSGLTPVEVKCVQEARCYLFPCVFKGDLIAAGLVWLRPGRRLDIEDIGVVDVYLSTAGVILQRMYAVRTLHGSKGCRHSVA